MLSDEQRKALNRIEKLEKIDKDPKGQILELADLAENHIKENKEDHEKIYSKIQSASLEADKKIQEVVQAIEDIELLEPEHGKDGYTPVRGKDYFDGEKGEKGERGKDGKDGYTPIKGLDYFDEINAKLA